MNKKQLKELIANQLLPLGFKVVKDMFFRRCELIFLVIDLDKSRYGGNFAINIGIYVDDDQNLEFPPPFHQIHIKDTLTRIVPQNVRDELISALNLEITMKDNARSTIISKAIKQHGLPFLNSLSSIEGIAYYIDPDNVSFLVTVELRNIIGRLVGRDLSI